MGQQAVNAGDSDIVNMLTWFAHQFGGDDRFFGYRDVAGSRRDDHDHALAALFAIALEDDGASEGTILGLVHAGGDGVVLLFGGSRRQHVAAVGREAGEDVGNLARRFARRKDHFACPGAGRDDDRPWRIPGSSREMAQALDGVVGGEALFPDLVEQHAQGFGIHVDLGGLLCNLTWE